MLVASLALKLRTIAQINKYYTTVHVVKICNLVFNVCNVRGVSKMAKKKEAERSAQSCEVNKQDKSENNDDEPNFSDHEGFVDNISDEGNLCA
jgi:hypothetical protein